MNPIRKVEVGKTGVFITQLGVGCGGFIRSKSDNQVIETFQTAINQGINYFDIAPAYGFGLSERRFGNALKNYEGDDLVISTKVGRLLPPDTGENVPAKTQFIIYDYSRGAILKSLASSLDRLGVDHVDILFIHDPDNHYEQAFNEAYPTLMELKDDGIVKAIGAGMCQWEMELRLAQEGDFDCFLLAGHYSLLDHSALDSFLPYCEEHRISVILGGAYESGVLANPNSGDYKYQKAPQEIVEKAIEFKKVCDKYGVPLKAAALQFGMAHPAVISIIPGTKSPEYQRDNFQMLNYPTPTELWSELREKKMIDPDAPIPS